jgi:hypothetical protein
MEFLIVWSVIAIITTVHILVFEFISKKYFSNLPRAINAILRGFVVGVCVNYFFFLILAFLSGSYFVMVSVFGLPLSILVGIVTTSTFWFVLSKLGIGFRLVELFALVAIIGVITGILVNAFVMRHPENMPLGGYFLIIFYFCSMNLAAARMLAKQNLYD